VLSKLNKNKEAEDALKSAVAINDSFDLGYVALASLQTVNKDYAGAVKSYEKALSVTANENLKTTIKESISKTYLAAGNNSYKDKKYDQSIEWMMKSITNSPSDAAYFGLAKAYIEKKKYADAITALDSTKTMQKTVTDGAIAYYRGLIQLNKGEDSKAIDSFSAALNDPTYKKASQTQIEYLKKKQKETKK
jgi:tetratricopeptide (TPR) repeat protein